MGLEIYNVGKGYIGFYHIDKGTYEVYKTFQRDDTAFDANHYGKVFLMSSGNSDHSDKDYVYWSYDFILTYLMRKK